MNDVIYALKQEIADYVNNSEANLMASTLNAHDTEDGLEYHTMAILYRHGPSDLITEEFRSIVLEFGWDGDSLIIAINKCILGLEEPIHRKKHWIGGSGPNPCVPSYQLELGTSKPKSKMNTIGDSLTLMFCVYQEDPQVVIKWVLKNSVNWLLQRLKFVEAFSNKTRS